MDVTTLLVQLVSGAVGGNAAGAAMKKFSKSYETHIFDGAGHGFLGNQAGAGGANLKASEQAWPLTIAFFKKHLG